MTAVNKSREQTKDEMPQALSLAHGSPRVISEGFFVSRQDRGYSEFLGPCGEWYQSFHMRSIFDDRDSAELALARANNPVSHAG